MLKLIVASLALAVVAAQTKSKYCELMSKVDCDKFDKLDAHVGPHCADNGVTYNSTCEKAKAECLLGHALHWIYHGHCDDKPTLPPLQDKCSEQWAAKYLKCDENSKPLCGSDMKTYKNYCEFHQARCNDVAKFGPYRAPKVYVKARGSTCEELPTRPPPFDSCKDYWLKQDCTKSRSNVFTKMCDSDQNVYDNRCFFYQAYCKDNTIRPAFCKPVRPTEEGSTTKPEQ